MNASTDASPPRIPVSINRITKCRTAGFRSRARLAGDSAFLEWARRHDSLPGLPASAVIYEEEVTRPADQLPQFMPEFVMAQLEITESSPAASSARRAPDKRNCER